MKKKILSLAILVSILIMSIPQNVYAEWKYGNRNVIVNIGETYCAGDYNSLLDESDAEKIQWATGNSTLPDNLTVTIDGGKAYLTGKVSEKNEIPGSYGVYIEEMNNDLAENYKTIQIIVNKGGCDITGLPDSINKKLGDDSFKLEPTGATNGSGESIEVSSYYYKSSNTSVATVESDGTVTIKGIGTTEITVGGNETDKYNPNESKVFLTVTDDSSPSTPDPTPNPSTPDSDQNQNTDNDNQSSNSTDNNNHSGDSNSKTETVETPNPFVVYLQSQTDMINNTKAGDTVIIESKSDLSLPLVFMKELQERKDITRKLSYNYKGLHYEITIPKGQAFVLDDTIPWYGPLKLSAMFGAEITPIK